MDEPYPSESSVLMASAEVRYGLHKLEQDLLKSIDQNPGIRYRELLRLTNSSNGMLSYHLAELEESKRVKVDRKSGVTRYYPVYISQEVSKIIGHIKNPVSKQIMSLLLKNNECTLSEITAFTMKAPSTVSWHLQRLIIAGIVRKKSVNVSDGIFYKSRFYHISDKRLIENIISKYIESSLDKVVNGYSDLIDELR